MVGVVSSIASGGNFIFADFKTHQCQFCTKLPEMSDLCYLGKIRLFSLHCATIYTDTIAIIRMPQSMFNYSLSLRAKVCLAIF